MVGCYTCISLEARSVVGMEMVLRRKHAEIKMYDNNTK